MSGIHSLLKRPERSSKRSRPSPLVKEESSNILSLSLLRGGSSSAPPKDDEEKVTILAEHMENSGIANLTREHIRHALHSEHAQGDMNKACDLLFLLEDSIEGIIRGYSPRTKLLGAENRRGVTCYMDALLFAMFARLDCFEAILYKSFDDESRRKLSILLRLWVNMLRSGNLITTDITKHLQEALAECGWEDAANLRQQDASEAFTFITEKLELPLLTLKMDIFHTGKEDASGDHKFVNERLLEVAIPEPAEGKTITLESCLESYFNNRIEVKRYLTRHDTLSSMDSVDSVSKDFATHIESVEVGSSTSSSPNASSPHVGQVTPLSSLRDSNESSSTLVNKPRRSSIVRERFIPDSDDIESDKNSPRASQDQSRKGSYRKEVMMPAWQFFNLIPWYTDNTQTEDAQVATHFSLQRPILGMCLKRYSMSSNGRATRLDTHVDIPTEIGLPYFIQGDNLDTDGPIHGNFKLSLQALVCHRGNSVDSGHYIAIVRGTSAGAPPAGSDQADSDPERYWMRFDDLAAERVTLVDIEQALKRESPYLLFYQILPMDEDPALANMSGTPISSASDDTQAFESKRLSQKIRGLFNWNFSGGRSDEHASSRPSFEISRPDSETELSGQIGRKANTAEPNSGGTDHTRGIEVHTEPQASPRLAPRDERDSSSSFSFSRRNSRPKSNPGSRAGSQVAENRISTTLSRLTRRLSRDKLATSGHPPDSEGSPVQNSPPEQMDGKSGGGDKSKGGTGHVSDQKGKWKAKSKAKTKSKEKKAGRSSERDCAFM